MKTCESCYFYGRNVLAGGVSARYCKRESAQEQRIHPDDKACDCWVFVKGETPAPEKTCGTCEHYHEQRELESRGTTGACLADALSTPYVDSVEPGCASWGKKPETPERTCETCGFYAENRREGGCVGVGPPQTTFREWGRVGSRKCDQWREKGDPMFAEVNWKTKETTEVPEKPEKEAVRCGVCKWWNADCMGVGGHCSLCLCVSCAPDEGACDRFEEATEAQKDQRKEPVKACGNCGSFKENRDAEFPGEGHCMGGNREDRALYGHDGAYKDWEGETPEPTGKPEKDSVRYPPTPSARAEGGAGGSSGASPLATAAGYLRVHLDAAILNPTAKWPNPSIEVTTAGLLLALADAVEGLCRSGLHTRKPGPVVVEPEEQA